MKLQIDLETYSDVNLRKCGLYKYVESDSYEILLLSYKLGNEPTKCVDLANGEAVPLRILRAIADKTITKTAHNAPFEIAGIMKEWLWLWKPYGIRDIPDFDPMQWEDTLIRVAALSLPLSLDGAGKALNLNIAKDKRGKTLINKFCVPCKPTKRNGMRTRNRPHHFPDDWEDFKQYNIRDVDVENAILRKIEPYNYITRFERRLWRLDYRINTRGIMLDRHFVNMVLRVDTEYRNNLIAEAIEITQLQNPNSLPQLRAWLEEAIGIEVPKLTKKDVAKLLNMKNTGPDVARILEIRKELGKTSVKKYLSMWNAICADDRIRGTLQMYGAARTGRWAGRLMQTHNLPKNDLEKDALKLARKIVRTGDLSLIQLCYDNVQYVLSQLIRTALVAPKNRRFIVGDFAAIEARVLAWLAGEQWRLKAFRKNRDIYLESASRMFRVPYDELVAMGKSSPYRQRGKIAELALGYQGAYGAMLTMGALEMGIPDDEILPIVKRWRNENENIVNLWYKVERAAKRVIQNGGSETLMHGIKFVREGGQFFIILPSGRRLTYLQPRLEVNKFGKLGIKYQGLNDKNKWAALDTYGGKLVENIVQAIARDLLAEAMINLDYAGYKIVFHVHDEIVAECRNDFGTCEEFDELMSYVPDWAEGLPLKVESFETKYYQK